MPRGAHGAAYLCCDDVATHAEFAAKGVAAGPLEKRFYAENGEFRVEDPDGHALMFTHL